MGTTGKKKIYKKKVEKKTEKPLEFTSKIDKKTRDNKTRDNKKNKVIRNSIIAFCVVLLLALFIVVTGLLLIKHYYNLTQFVPDDKVSTLDSADAESLLAGDKDIIHVNRDITNEAGEVIGTTDETININDLPDDERESILQSIEDEMNSASSQQSQIAEIPIKTSGDVYNLLLIGVDRRAGQSWNGNSDTMILVSINSAKKTITMTSFMRDLYANIPGVGAYKLNRSYALGGGPLLVQTLQENFRIGIDNYAWVDFYSLISIIDSIGGIDMEISADEARVANNYIKEMSEGKGIDPSRYYLGGGGLVHLNGMQAVAYARIRYVGNADFGRTERQRKVLAKMFEVLKQKSPTEVMDFLNTVLPLVTHNIPSDTVTKLILNSPSYLSYSLNSQRVPFDGTFTSVNEMLVPDFNYTINMLQSIIY